MDVQVDRRVAVVIQMASHLVCGNANVCVFVVVNRVRVVCVAERLERIECIWVSRRCQVRVKIRCRAKQGSGK